MIIRIQVYTSPSINFIPLEGHIAYLRIADAKAAARPAVEKLRKSAGSILREERSTHDINDRFDIFLSHSSDDADMILGVKRMVEAVGLSVYVDWIDDGDMDRTRVDRGTAETLRSRMRASSTLVYADSVNAAESKWMPWELGFFDGIKPQHIFILPLVNNADSEYKGREYLNLYPDVNAIRDLAGRIGLGFENVKSGNDRRTIMLKDAARGSGVFLSS
jgi:hypothetical protein